MGGGGTIPSASASYLHGGGWGKRRCEVISVLRADFDFRFSIYKPTLNFPTFRSCTYDGSGLVPGAVAGMRKIYCRKVNTGTCNNSFTIILRSTQKLYYHYS